MIMRRKESLYTVIGGIVGAILVMAASYVMPIGAQSGVDANFRKISCEEMEVVSVIGTVKISEAMINVKSEFPSDIVRGSVLEGVSGATLIAGGSIMISGDDGTALVDIRNDGQVGSVSVARAETDNLAATMGVNENGGFVSVHDFEKHGRAAAMMGLSKQGGLVAVTGKGDSKGQAAMGMSEYGSGVVNTWDKNGYRLAALK